MGRAKDDGGGAAVILGIIILGVLIGAGLLLFGSDRNPTSSLLEPVARQGAGTDDPTGPGRVEPIAPDATEEPGRLIGVDPAVDSVTEKNAGANTLTLRAVDSQSGQAVLRFWVRSSGFQDMAADIERWNSDPITGRVEVTFEGKMPPLTVLAHRYRPEEVFPSERRSITVKLRRGTSVVGTVRDASSAPAKAAKVELEYYGTVADPVAEGDPPRTPPVQFATLRRTDENGAYAFAGLPPGLYATRVTVGGIVRHSARREVRAGSWTTIDHWLDEHHRLVVEVRRPNGLPSEKARVLVSKPDTEEPLMARYTGPDGQVTFEPLVPHDYEVIVISDHGTHTPLAATISATGATTSYLTVRLEASNDSD